MPGLTDCDTDMLTDTDMESDGDQRTVEKNPGRLSFHTKIQR